MEGQGVALGSYPLYRNTPEIQREPALTIKIQNSRLTAHLVLFAATLDLRKFWASFINSHKAGLAKYGLLQGHRVSLGDNFLA